MPNRRIAHVRRTARMLGLVAIVFGLAVGLGPACTRGKSGAPPEAPRDFGALDGASRLSNADAMTYLASARAILEHRGRLDAGLPLPPPLPGRRVFLALWPPPGAGDAGRPVVASANAATLGDAVAAAAEAMADMPHDAARSRLELDIANAVDGMTLDEDLEVPIASVGLEGVFVIREDNKAAAILPGEVVERAMFRAGPPLKLDHRKMLRPLAERAGVGEPDLASMRAYRFRVDAYVESGARDRALRLTRGMVEHLPQVTPELLVEAARRGADYLARILNDQGRYVYLYHPIEDVDDTSYGLLRHAGTTYALLEAFEELGTPLYLQKAERALSYLKLHLVEDAASQGKYATDGNNEEQQKSGGAGLALLAFAKHAALTGKSTELETMRALARFIIAQQYADGHFRANVDLPDEPGGKRRKPEPVYYQGEAALGLLRLYAVDRQSAYLDAARKAVDWVVHVRDADVPQDRQEHDHWVSYAINELYRLGRDDSYIEHSYKIARAILNKQHREKDSPAPDWVGTFFEGQTTPGATRLEAYAADIALSRFAGRPDAWLLEPAREVAASMLGQQFVSDNDYWLRNSPKVEGGVRESLVVQDVRIDYVQHAMSAWLHLAREIRDPSYGKSGVPSQDSPRSRSDAL